jgi:hypothetical protein
MRLSGADTEISDFQGGASQWQSGRTLTEVSGLIKDGRVGKSCRT